jgi:hypothetical protein
MLFVCLSHFTSSFLDPWKNAALSPALAAFGVFAVDVSLIATPSFILISGIVIGFMYEIDRVKAAALRQKLIDRGLFLLLVGHPLQAAAYVNAEGVGVALRWSFVTDAIAVAILIGPTLVFLTATRFRLVAGTLLLILSWAAALWQPHSSAGVVINRYAFGGSSGEGFVGFPVIPWLGVYLLGTTLGQRMGLLTVSSAESKIEWFVRRVGATAVAIGLGFFVVKRLLRTFVPAGIASHREIDAFLGALTQKYPPGLLYLLTFGGAGLVLISVMITLSREARWDGLTRPFATVGRASFFVFVLQTYVYYLLLPAAHLRYPQLWPAYFLATLLILMLASAVWNRFGANRYLTVGLWRTVPLARQFRMRLRTALALH